MSYWGYHMILDASRCSAYKIRCAPTIAFFAKTLVHEIDMTPYGEPQIVHFGIGNKSGYTLVQLIETSNICAHFVEDTDDMYLDVFSCKPFSPSTVESVVKRYFEPQHINKSFLSRQAGVKNGSKHPTLQLK